MSKDCFDISLGLVDHAANCSGSDIDSDLESALYSQLHHEPNFTEDFPAISKVAASAHYVDYNYRNHVDPKNDFEAVLNPPRRPLRYHGNRYSRHDPFRPNYSEEFKYQPETRLFSNKRFFNSHLLADHPNKIQCNNERIFSRPTGVFTPIQKYSNEYYPNEFHGREVNTERILSQNVTPVTQDFIPSYSSERRAARSGKSKRLDTGSKDKAYELITLSDSPIHQEKNNQQKKLGPPFIQWLLKANSLPGNSRKRPYVSEEEVIDVTDSPIVVSDTTIEVPSSSDDEDVILIDKNQSNDILTNLEGYRPVGELEVEIEDTLKKMSGNPDLWRINERDRFPESYRQTFQYQHQFRLLKVTCMNCRERGHLSRNCNKPKRLIVCFLCGSGGHEASMCPLPPCGRCMRLGHQVQQCQWPQKYLEKKCPSCKMKGHLREECPDNWRKYHLTTYGSSVITNTDLSSEHESMKTSCYNCGRPGHLGHECKKQRMYKYVFPSLPWVVNYNNPSACVGTQKEKNDGQAPKDRETFLRKLYREKLRLAEASNEKYAGLMANANSSHRKRFGLRGSKKKGKKWRPDTQTVVRNGQIYYPRERGAMGNSGSNLLEKIQVAFTKKQKFCQRWRNGAKKFTSRFHTPTRDATSNSFRKRRNK